MANLSEETDCFEGSLEERLVFFEMFYVIVFFGTFCAVISTVENLLLFMALSDPNAKSYIKYLRVLSLLDASISFFYVVLIVVDLLKDYYQSYAIAQIWWIYFIPGLALCHSLMTSATYLVLAATLERFLLVCESRLHRFYFKQRRWLTVMVFLVAFVAKMPMVFELQLENNGNCTGSNKYLIDLTELAKTPFYRSVYRFWFRHLACVIFPFISLSYLNTRIVLQIRQQHNMAASNFRLSLASCKLQRRARKASLTLVLVVCTYLASNLLNFVIVIWEFIDMESLLEHHYGFYVVGTDLVSILTVFSCALRLPLHLACNSEIRKLVARFLLNRCPCLIQIVYRYRRTQETML